jgi:hypothetical protein
MLFQPNVLCDEQVGIVWHNFNHDKHKCLVSVLVPSSLQMLVGVVATAQTPKMPRLPLLKIDGAPHVELVVYGVDDLVNTTGHDFLSGLDTGNECFARHVTLSE